MVPSFASMRGEKVPPTRKSTEACANHRTHYSLLDVIRRDPRTPDFFDGCSDGDFNGNLHGIMSSAGGSVSDAKRRKYFSSSTVTTVSFPVTPQPCSTYLNLEALPPFPLYIISHPAAARF